MAGFAWGRGTRVVTIGLPEETLARETLACSCDGHDRPRTVSGAACLEVQAFGEAGLDSRRRRTWRTGNVEHASDLFGVGRCEAPDRIVGSR